MEPGTTLALATLAVTGNYIVWGLKPGAALYDLVRFSSETYDEHLRSTVERLLGLHRKEITVENSIENGKSVFTFSNVAITSPKEIEELISTKSDSDKKVDLATREKEIKKKKRERGETESTTDIQAQEGIKHYSITLHAKQAEIALGDITSPDWSLHNSFDITITEEGKHAPLDKKTLEYKAALSSLERSLKRSSELPANFDQSVNLEMQSSLGGTEVVKFWRTFLKDRTTPPSFDSTHITDSVRLNRSIDPSEAIRVFNKYFNELNDAIKIELSTAKKTKEMLEMEVKKRKSKSIKDKAALISKTAISIPIAPIVVFSVLALIIVVMAITIPPNVLIPGFYITISFLKTAITQVLSIFNKNVAGLLSLGSITIALGIFTKGIRDYKNKKMARRNAEEELKETSTAVEELEATLKNIESMRNGMETALKTIEAFINAAPENKTLDLSDKNISDIELAAICHYLGKTDSLKKCETILLSNNKITDQGVKELASTIKSFGPDSNVHTINLTGNNVGEEGIIALRESLQENFSVTTLKCDFLDAKINKHLIINCCLQNRPYDKNLISGTFDQRESELNQAVREKIENNFDITKPFPGTINSEFTELAQKVVEQNGYLQKLLPSGDDPTPAFIENSSAAFELDSGRTITFFSAQLLVNTETRQKIAKMNGVDAKKKTDILTIYDQLIHQDKKPLDIQKYQLRKLFTNTNLDSDQIFEEFIEIFRKVPEDKIENILNQIDKFQFRKLIEADKSTAYKKIIESGLSETQKKPLLVFCDDLGAPLTQESKPANTQTSTWWVMSMLKKALGTDTKSSQTSKPAKITSSDPDKTPPESPHPSPN